MIDPVCTVGGVAVHAGQVLAILGEDDAATGALLAGVPGLRAPDVSSLDADRSLREQAGPEPRFGELLVAFGIAHRLDDPVEHLSRGTRQRVVLAQALSSPARLLVFAEPFAGLDSLGCNQFLDLLARHCEVGGAAVLTTHLLGQVRPFADLVLDLDAPGADPGPVG